MHGPSCWFAASRRAAVLTWLTAAVVLGASSVSGATVVDRDVRHEIHPDGSILERTHLRVRLETSADLFEWSDYAIYLDDHRNLESVEARVIPAAGGSPTTLKKKHQDEVESAGRGLLHSSARYHVLRFPPESLETGAVLDIAHRVRVAPYFPGGAVDLFLGPEPVASMSIEVTGAPQGFRWHLDGLDAGVRVVETGSGVRVAGEDVEPPTDLEQAPADATQPVLRYAWGPAATWNDVGRWYQDLRNALPPTSESVRSTARELVRGLEDPRERLERLLGYAGKTVRYVAVEVGIGGFRPSTPDETLERGWGDCKDKATLLVDLLEEAGLRAHPALILSSTDGRIDPSFPSPFVFNHMIVAVETEGMPVGPTDPVSEGFLFVDPTHDRGTSRWLHGAVQNQHALVVRESGSTLIPTPSLFDANVRELAVDLDVDPGGTARGTVELTLSGEYGSVVQELVAAVNADRMEEVVRSVASAVLPGVDVHRVGWGFDDGGVPRGNLQAGVSIDKLLPTGGDRISFHLPSLSRTPPTSILDDRSVPVVVDAGESRERWTLALPRDGCRPDSDDVSVETPAGSYHQSMTVEGKHLQVDRSLVLTHRWIESELFDALRDLALAETRSKKRRLRLVCE